MKLNKKTLWEFCTNSKRKYAHDIPKWISNLSVIPIWTIPQSFLGWNPRANCKWAALFQCKCKISKIFGAHFVWIGAVQGYNVQRRTAVWERSRTCIAQRGLPQLWRPGFHMWYFLKQLWLFRIPIQTSEELKQSKNDEITWKVPENGISVESENFRFKVEKIQELTAISIIVMPAWGEYKLPTYP